MKDTLLEGDFILVNKTAYSISTPHQIPFWGKRLARTELVSTGKPEFNDVVALEIPANYLRSGCRRLFCFSKKNYWFARGYN